MWNWTDHMGGWWWLAVPMMMAFWGVVIWAVVTVFTGRRRPRAEDILDERFARGELDEDEYRARSELVRKNFR